MMKKIHSERGSYTLEACISLMVMVIAVAFVYSQIKVVICESIMQHAVDNMALEVSSYVYILDKAGVVVHKSEDDFKEPDEIGSQANSAIQSAKSAAEIFANNSNNITELLGLLDNTDGSAGNQLRKQGSNMVSSIKKIIEIAKGADWKKIAKNAGTSIVDSGVTVLANEIMNSKGGFYDEKLDDYLPTERSKFCKEYLVDENSISFEYSRVFPGVKNNTIIVAVTYQTNSPFSWFPIKRKIVKQAYTAAWLADPSKG